MKPTKLPRRSFLTRGSSMMVWAAMLSSPWFAHAFPGRPGEELVPFTDKTPPLPDDWPDMNLMKWEDLDSWITPNDKFFSVAHYNVPALTEADWRLDVTGMVERGGTYTLRDIKARPRKDVVFTLECSGNHGFPWFVSAIGNAKWAGTPLASLLEDAGIKPGGIEVVFFGYDEGEETVRNIAMKQEFARSMSVEDAMSPANLLCYEMNGTALPQANGFPVRLIAPGWYGIANVKWLKRIEVRRTRFMGKFMARDYVNIREETRDGESVWVETSVGRSNLKSAPAKVTRKDGRYRIYGAAWGAPIAQVEVRVDDGPWTRATIDRSNDAPNAWKIWSLDWANPTTGEHGITSRAIDTTGNIQPALTDPVIAKKRTYWESYGQVTRRVRVS